MNIQMMNTQKSCRQNAGKYENQTAHVLIPCIGTAGKTLIFMFFAPKKE